MLTNRQVLLSHNQLFDHDNHICHYLFVTCRVIMLLISSDAPCFNILSIVCFAESLISEPGPTNDMNLKGVHLHVLRSK